MLEVATNAMSDLQGTPALLRLLIQYLTKMDDSRNMLYAALCKHFGYIPGKRASPQLLRISRQLQTE